MVGKELAFDPALGTLEKLYVRIFGAPISGLRIRFRRLMPQLRRLISTKSGQKAVSIVDIGCGTGLFTLEMAKELKEAQVVGLDNSEELIKANRAIADQAQIKNCRFELADVLDLGTDHQYDFAVCIDNLEHIEDDQRVIDNIHACLVQGGTALFHVPGLYRRWFFFTKQVNFDVKGHVRPGYTQEQITDKIEKAGFTVTEAYYTYGWLETVCNNISYLITGADRRNKHLYALAFPVLNLLAFLGQWARPAWGAGVVVLARKNGENHSKL